MKREEQNLELLEIFSNYEKSDLWKQFENYEKNLQCIRDVADRVLSHMKGHGVSFKPEITDGEGYFSQEKLMDFVEQLLTRWAAKQREGTFTDPSTGESMAEPYIRARQELYGCYLYLAMRCSLLGDMNNLVGRDYGRVRQDFAFLLEQAGILSESWCVMEGPDGGRENGLFWGYDHQFGLHLYHFFYGGDGFDHPDDLPVNRPAFLTDEGSVKRNQLKRIYCGCAPFSLAEKAERTMKAEEAAQPEGDALDTPEDGGNCGCDRKGCSIMTDDNGNGEGRCKGEGSCDMEERDGMEEDCGIQEDFDYDFEYDSNWEDEWLMAQGLTEDEMADYKAAEYEAGAIRVQEDLDREYLAQSFDCQGEYLRKCERFVQLFQQAGADVLRGFRGDLEEIVALYLIERGLPPLMDTDQALRVYGSIYDKALPLARRCERGILWKTM